jgi:predicted nuclease of restriction endonuclease-like (RecB) superfamily
LVEVVEQRKVSQKTKIVSSKKDYIRFITELKRNIVRSRYIAASLANREQLLLYFRTGKMLSEKIATQKWGVNVLQSISSDLQKQLPGLRGFSYRNLRNMRQFFEVYNSTSIWQSLTAKLQSEENRALSAKPTAKLNNPALEAFFGISFTHHILLLNRCGSMEERFFYIFQASTQLWSVAVLEHNINANLFRKKGKLPNNFTRTLPKEIDPSAREVFKDEYLMDFMRLDENADEREVESEIVGNIKEFILRMGKGFCFIGNQYRIELDGEEFFIDLLFYNRYLKSMVVFELKRGRFQPEYAGKLNFYLNVLDKKIKLPHENPSIGIILCKEKNNTVVEFSIKTINKPIGVSTYRISRKIPEDMKNVLPKVNELIRLI